MKFVDIRSVSEIKTITIIHPKQSDKYKYYYPDGIEMGWWFKHKTCFLSKEDSYSNYLSVYYTTVEEAIKDSLDETLYNNNGKIWILGRVIIKLRGGEEFTMIFKEHKDLEEYFENLIFKWGIDLNSYVCLETPETISLYEYKTRRFKETEV